LGKARRVMIPYVSHGIAPLSIPIASQRLSVRAYSGRMAKRPWQDWGTRFRNGCREKGTSTRKVSEKLDLAESTVRSWINGTREINLSDFFRLCAAAGLDPASILFAGHVDPAFLAIGKAWAQSDRRGRELLIVAAEAAVRLSESEASGSGSSAPRS
jgi:transcriptional regulator with XRE-family HTH domain